MNQLAIDFDAQRLVRHTDPMTSVDAALRADFCARHMAKIWAALKQGELTIYGLADATGLTHVQVARRMIQGNEQLWERTGRRAPTPSGRSACVWRAING